MTEMAPAESFRWFINERLTAAAEEIFGAFQRAVREYEEEIDRQRRLLEVGKNPQVQLCRPGVRPEFPQQSSTEEDEAPSNQERSSSSDQPGPTVWKSPSDLQRTELSQKQLNCNKEEAAPEQQLSHHEKDQDDPEPLRIKEEPERLRTFQGGEHLELKQEAEPFEYDLPREESSRTEPQINGFYTLFAHSSSVTENQTPGKPNPEGKLQKSRDPSPGLLGDLLSPGKAAMSFRCDTCGEVFRDLSELQTHLLVHSGETINPGEICEKIFSSMSQTQTQIHTGEKPYSCKICKKHFSTSYVFKRHMRAHTGKPHSESEQFSQKIDARSHVHLSFKSSGQALSDDSVLKTETHLKPHSCSTCGQRFSDMSDLNMHVQSHQEDRPFACEACGKCFRLKAHLSNHKATHTREKNVSCDTCGKVFGNKTILNSHATIHTGERPFMCKTCGKSFRLKSDLTSHMRRHTGERPCSCRFCGKGFYDKSDLNKHIKIHTGEKPFSCEICGKSFKRGFVLTVHMRTHTGEMPYPCSSCGMVFRRKSDLSRHTNHFHTGEMEFLLN